MNSDHLFESHVRAVYFTHMSVWDIMISVMPEFLQWEHYGNKVAKVYRKFILSHNVINKCLVEVKGKAIIAAISYVPANEGYYQTLRLTYDITSLQDLKDISKLKYSFAPIREHLNICHVARKRYLKLKKRGMVHKFQSRLFYPFKNNADWITL